VRPGDMRDWLAAAEAAGEVREVRGADWRLEIGALCELDYRLPHPWALLFDDIVGYPRGRRLLTAAAASAPRLGLALRMGADWTTLDLVQALRGKFSYWADRAAAFPPRWVEDGPVAECEQQGAAVDLEAFPAPLWHEDDGGRYIGTGCLLFSRDPDTGWINAGTYRMQLHDRNRLGLFALSGKHARIHLDKYAERRERCPVVVSLGHDPLFALLGGLEVPYGVSELDYAGAIAEQPVEVLKGLVTGLPLLARAEIVAEGWIYPGDTCPEGPYGEFHGYYSAAEAPQPVIHVERLLHRRDPILLGSPPGRPPHDYSYWVSILRSAVVFDALVDAGVPDVQAVWQHECGGARMLLAVAIKQRYPGHARQAGHVAAQCRGGAQVGRYVVVVDEDVDPTDLEQVMWAVATRSDPVRDIDFIQRAWGSQVDPQHVTLPDGGLLNSRAIIDACRPYEYRDVFPRTVGASPALLARTRTKWAALLGDQG
jgi:UbiD family decarboxylase